MVQSSFKKCWFHLLQFLELETFFFIFWISTLAISVNSLDISDLSTIKNYCGYLEFKTLNGTTRLNVTEGQVVPENLFRKTKKELHNVNRIYFHDESKECQISLCGFHRVEFFKYEGDCIEMTLTQNVSYAKEHSIDAETTSISCGCKKDHENHLCDMPKCDVRPLELDTCAILYREANCQDCLYEEFFLKHGDTFETKNSAVIRSLIVNPECTVRKRTFGTFYEEKMSNVYFNKSQCCLEPSYYSKGESFSCRCPHLETDDTVSVDAAFIASIVLVLIFIFSVIISVLRYRLQKQKQSRPKLPLTKDNRKECIEMMVNPSIMLPHSDEGTEDIQTQQHPSFDIKFIINRKNLKINYNRPLGKGKYGEVYEGTFPNPDSKVAVKTFGQSLDALKTLINEIVVLSYIGSHPNIVSFIGAYKDFESRHIEVLQIMELLEESMENYLLSKRKLVEPIVLSPPSVKINVNVSVGGVYCNLQPITPPVQNIEQNSLTESSNLWQTKAEQVAPDLFKNLVKWSMEIAAGMEYLNEKKVLHIDLAVRNILLDKNLTAKISDFGLSRRLYEKDCYEKTEQIERLPLKWFAFESLFDRQFTAKSDIWSYGVTIWEIFSLCQEPYDDIDNFRDILAFLAGGQRLEKPPLAKDEIYDVMQSCWEQIPESRPSFSELKDIFSQFLNQLEILESELQLND